MVVTIPPEERWDAGLEPIIKVLPIETSPFTLKVDVGFVVPIPIRLFDEFTKNAFVLIPTLPFTVRAAVKLVVPIPK